MFVLLIVICFQIDVTLFVMYLFWYMFFKKICYDYVFSWCLMFDFLGISLYVRWMGMCVDFCLEPGFCFLCGVLWVSVCCVCCLYMLVLFKGVGCSICISFVVSVAIMFLFLCLLVVCLLVLLHCFRCVFLYFCSVVFWVFLILDFVVLSGFVLCIPFDVRGFGVFGICGLLVALFAVFFVLFSALVLY